jgi:signal transduction histidine kinase
VTPGARRSASIVAAFAFAAAAVIAVAWRSAAMERSRVERDFGERLDAQAGEAAARVGAFVEQAQQRAATDPESVVVEGFDVVSPRPSRPLARLADSGGEDPIGDAQLAAAAELEVDPARTAEAEAIYGAIVEAASERAHPAVLRLAWFRLAALLEREGRREEASAARRAFVDELPVDGDERRSAEALFARIAVGERSDALRDDLLLALGNGDDAIVLGMARDAAVDEAAIGRRRGELEKVAWWTAYLRAPRPLIVPVEWGTELRDGELIVAAPVVDGRQRVLRLRLDVPLPPNVSLDVDPAAFSSPSPFLLPPPSSTTSKGIARRQPIENLAGFAATATATDAELTAETRRRLSILGLSVGGLLAGGALLLWFTLRAVRRESEAAAARTAFVARVSHDLRTPLSVIRMYAETLASGRASRPEEVREFAGVAAREAERLTELVARVLDFSRAAKGRVAPTSESVDLGAILRELTEEQRPALAAAGMQLGLVVSGEPLLVRGDRQGLRTACANLIENALRHAASGARVEIAAAPRVGNHRRDPGEGGSREIEVTVSDRGPGLPPGLESKIFEPFVRGPQARPGGSGLGLALVREIATAHRGRVTAANREGGGATFRLQLPRAEPGS